ncbi:hypothetical protein QFZ67_007640 [Streptomyces sp. V1I1]|nr:hypothetical protein [Streptomyces sp. V1I1]MDQ0945935.1 hypothetical protein [Streptomyces sp. V1I1]
MIYKIRTGVPDDDRGAPGWSSQGSGPRGGGWEAPNAMLTSPAYNGLAKLLSALRAHDARIEKLTEPSTSRTRTPEPRDENRDWDEDRDKDADREQTPTVSRPAKDLLRFSAPRDARQLAAFIELRSSTPSGCTGGAASRPPSATPRSTRTCACRTATAPPPTGPPIAYGAVQ